jgi:hypothetical protein
MLTECSGICKCKLTIGCPDDKQDGSASPLAAGYVSAGWLVEWGNASVYRKTKDEAYDLAHGINAGNQWQAVAIELFREEI